MNQHHRKCTKKSGWNLKKRRIRKGYSSQYLSNYISSQHNCTYMVFEYMPARHDMQDDGRVFEYVPAGHTLHSVAFPLEKVPGSQSMIDVAPSPYSDEFCCVSGNPVARQPGGVGKHPVVSFLPRFAAVGAYRPKWHFWHPDSVANSPALQRRLDSKRLG